MRDRLKNSLCTAVLVTLLGSTVLASEGAVKAYQGTVTIPTYPWQEDINPKFWAMESGPKLSTTVKGAIVYPYTMQDHLLRTKVDRTYQALFLENEYLKITCLPELGGRLHSVFDKTRGEEMFHLNGVIKPSMIAMRGAWIGGGVEWNSGPHGHTVTIVSPVNALVGRNEDGSAYLEISNQEQIFRTRWTVRVTLHPGKAYLDERISIFNPTDGMHPYYFWNCTAFPCRSGTRFIYPMTLGTDHGGRKFFDWPIHEGRDLTWLKNYPEPSSIFSVDCRHGFFGAYDVDADRGIVQISNPYELGGKKAWTWGTSDFGRVCQENLSDGDGGYIEVQSGPLPTQSDYGMLGPREEIAWQEWWYPVHGLGDGFEAATRDLAVRTERRDGRLELRLLATGRFPEATCSLSREGRELLSKKVDLSPAKVQVVALPDAGESPVDVMVKAQDGQVLGSFATPLPIHQTPRPKLSMLMEKPDEQLTLEEKYLKGRKHDRATGRAKARQYYEMALKEDPDFLLALRALAVLDIEAGLHAQAIERLERATHRDGDDGLSWYFLGVCRLRMAEYEEAVRCGYRAARCSGTASLGYDLVGRASMRLGNPAAAVEAFTKAVRLNLDDARAGNNLMLALYRQGATQDAFRMARRRLAERPTDLVARALAALETPGDMQSFGQEIRRIVGEDDFEMIETSLAFADLGLFEEAAKVLAATRIEGVAESDLSPLPLYYLAYYASQSGDETAVAEYLRRAAGIDKDSVFPSRTEAVDVLSYAVEKNPQDANARLCLGNLYADLGRLDEAAAHWQEAARLKPSLSVALRNLGVYHASVKDDLAKAESLYRRAIEARPDDQTLFRDLAEILIALDRRPEAIQLMETMPFEKIRRADIIIMLAQAYFDSEQYGKTIELLESTPYFVNWEGQTITWELFNRAHIERGRERLEAKDFEGALADFEAALTYPENIGVGRSNKPEEAPGLYWKGKALEARGRLEEARAAWKAGVAGAKGSGRQKEYRERCGEALKGTR